MALEIPRENRHMANTDEAIALIVRERAKVAAQSALLVAVSGIDGSGKGYITEKIVTQLLLQRLRVASINIDGWLHLPEKRFSTEHSAEHFYKHGIRFEEMFGQLVLPLKEMRSHRTLAQLADATNASACREHLYEFEDVDIVILEGIFLLKKAFRAYYDLSLWVDCTFATALERAVQRGQEGLPREETIRDFETIYFPAQRIHIARDDPRTYSTLIITNDPRLDSGHTVGFMAK